MKKAFTLAEVLITLTIIGVIAAITIPNLMQKWQDQHTVSAVKEAYSILNNAMKIMMQTEHYDDLMELAWENSSWITYSKHPLVDLKPYLRISKYCDSVYSTDCWDNTKVKTLNNIQDAYGAASGTDAVAVLANGMVFSVPGVSNNVKNDVNNVTGYIRVDINGKKGPNRHGYDIFFLPFNKNGMTVSFPYGGYNGGTKSCAVHSAHNEGASDGAGCAIWILKHGNVDYKYRDVSAEW